MLQNHYETTIYLLLWLVLSGLCSFSFTGWEKSKLGNGASSWILHMATIILTANFWGFYRKEWIGVQQKTIRTILIGIMLILLSVVIVGIGNSLEKSASGKLKEQR
ncbi:MAG: L-rhamnose/proton symporter RhaT [Cyclobacteriaceae bacterium]|nr:L-rhamnose/proton symporter RhaT [Cyclobacteriaceae bacterium]